MSTHSSDSKEAQDSKRLKGWAFVTPHGEVESDKESSSSLEFVNLDEETVTFHRSNSQDREKSTEKQTGQDREKSAEKQTRENAAITSTPPQDTPQLHTGFRDLEAEQRNDCIAMETSMLTTPSDEDEYTRQVAAAAAATDISSSGVATTAEEMEYQGEVSTSSHEELRIDDRAAVSSGDDSRGSSDFEVLDDGTSAPSDTSNVEEVQMSEVNHRAEECDVMETSQTASLTDMELASDHSTEPDSHSADDEEETDHLTQQERSGVSKFLEKSGVRSEVEQDSVKDEMTTLAEEDGAKKLCQEENQENCQEECSKELQGQVSTEELSPGVLSQPLSCEDAPCVTETSKEKHLSTTEFPVHVDGQPSGFTEDAATGGDPSRLYSKWLPVQDHYAEFLEYDSGSDTELQPDESEELPPLEDSSLASGSEGSDFVKLDVTGDDEQLLEQPVSPSMNVMDISSSSHSSVSANFSFFRPYPRLVHIDSDDDSLPGDDVDDRTESDQSVGGDRDDDDSDLSSLAYGLGDTPLDDGRQIIIYRHYPNKNLNSKLTCLAVMSLMLAIGVGLGHFLGSLKEGNLCRQQVMKLREMQDKYLMCMRQQDYIENVHSKLTQNIKELEEEVLSWKQKYLEVESSDPQQKKRLQEIDVLQKKMTELSSINEDMETLKTEHHLTKSLLGQQRALEEELRYTITELQKDIVQLENEKMVEARSCQAVRDQLNQRSVENHDLKQAVAKLRYLQHPANTDQPDVTTVEVRGQINTLNNENHDLKTAVARMRYSQALSDDNAAQESGETGDDSLKVSEDLQLWVSMKKRLNDLAVENEDLKQSVMKLRYGLPELEQNPGTSNTKTDGDSPGTAQLLGLRQKLADVTHELHVEKERSEMWQTMFVAERTKFEQLKTEQGKSVPSFFTCMSILLPTLNWTQFIQNVQLDGAYFNDASKALWNQWVFFQNMTADSAYMEELAKKWEEFERFMNSDIEEYAAKAKAVYEDIQRSISSKWKEFQEEKFANFQNHAENVKESLSQFADSVKEKVAEMKDWADADNINSYVMKSREAVAKLGVKLQDTWNQLKNMSAEFLQEQEPTLSRLRTNVVRKVSKVGEKIQNKFKKVKNSLKHKYEGWTRKQEKRQRKQETRRGRDSKKQKRDRRFKQKFKQDEHDNVHQSQWEGRQNSNHNKQEPRNDPPKYHQQKHRRHSRRTDEAQNSSQDKGKFILDPDEILEDTIFGSGGYRHQKKTQKRFRKLYDRIQSYDEQAMHDMDDDDDIDDLYDDLEEFQHDMENVDYQGGMLTWLTCQLRWWKSRHHRKHRDEDILNGCGRHMMQFQIHQVRGPPSCKTCSRSSATATTRRRPLCADSQKYQNCNRKSFKNCHKQDKKCQKNCRNQKKRNGKMSDDEQPWVYKKSNGPAKNHHKRSSRTEPLHDNESYRYHHDDDIPSSDWFSRRMEHREDGRHDASWYFDRMEDREDHHHDSMWYIRAMQEKSKTDNNPEWYINRLKESSNKEEQDYSWLFDPIAEQDTMP